MIKKLSTVLTLLLLAFSFSSYGATFVINSEASSEIKENVLIYLNEVNAPVSQYEIDDYEQSLIQKAKKAVEAFGYYNSKVSVAPFKYNANTELNVEISIVLNEIAIVTNVVMQHDISNINGLPEPLARVINGTNALKGKPLNHSQYESLKNQLSTYALLYGYFDFQFILHKLLVLENATNTASTGTVHWIFNIGERYKFGDLVFLSNTRGNDIATNVKPFKTGEYFEQSKVGEFSINLASTKYFSSAIARANVENAENKLVPIEVILKPKPKDLFKYGIGVSTDTGPRISIDWTRPWVNTQGNSLGASLYLSSPEQRLSLVYKIPKDNPLKDFLTYQVGVKRTDENQTLSNTLTFAIQRQWGAKDEIQWDKIGFLKIEQESFTQGLQDEETTLLVMPGFTLNRIRKRGEIFVDWGDRQQLTVEGASENLLSDIDLFKVTARTKWIREYDRHRVVARGDLGLIATNDFSEVPSTHRFFAGGDQSVRGFGLNEVTDVNEVEVDGEIEYERVGGKFLAVASLEYAYRFAESWRAAVFFDAGSASETFGESLATGTGAGVHWLSPIGNVQIYIARGQSDFENTWRLHLVIGPGL